LSISLKSKTALPPRHYAKTAKAPTLSQAPAISAVFDQFRQQDDAADSVGVEGTMGYLQAIGVSVEEPTMIAIMQVTGSEAMGDMERNKFVSGWESHSSSVSSLQTMQSAANQMRAQLITDPVFFKAVYKHAFLLSRMPGQKSAALEMAIEFWRLLFSDKGLQWRTQNVDWLELWCKFLNEGSVKVVSRDVWNQLESFARKTIDDESLGFWSEESSWPTAIDEFVAYAKKSANAMDVE